MRICIRCKKREGSWWDHLCGHCKHRPLDEKRAIEYDRLYEPKNVLTPKQAQSLSEDNATNNKSFNKSAVIGLVLSIIAAFLGMGLAGIAGFILGIVALVQIKHTHQKGKGIAIAAIIIGFVWGFVIGILKKLVEVGF